MVNYIKLLTFLYILNLGNLQYKYGNFKTFFRTTQKNNP